VSAPAERLLLLVRHAEPRIDASIPASRWELSERGLRAAARLVPRLAPYAPGACFSSPEPKARQTAETIARPLGLDVVAADALHEHERAGVPFFADPEAFRRAILRLFETPEDRVFGGESAVEAEARFRGGVDRAMSSTDARAVIVAAHGTVMSLYAGRRLGRPAADIWSSLGWGATLVLPWGGSAPDGAVRAVEIDLGG